MATVEKRLQADGTVSFRAKIRIKGALPQTASFAWLTDARKWAQSAEAAIREGRHFGYQETKRHTVADLIERYARDVLRQDSPDVENRKRQLAWPTGRCILSRRGVIWSSCWVMKTYRFITSPTAKR